MQCHAEPILAALALAVALTAQAEPPFRLEPVRTIEVGRSIVRAAAYAPNGAQLCTGGESGDVILWDVRTQARRWRVHPSRLRIAAIAFPPDGNTVAVAGHAVTLHDASSGAERLRLSAAVCRAVAFAPDGGTLAFAQAPDMVALVDARTGAPRASWQVPGPVTAIAFASGGRSLAIGNASGRVHRVNLADGSVEFVAQHHHRNRVVACRGLAFAGDDLVSCGAAGDLFSGEREFTIAGDVDAVAFAPSANAFAVGGTAGIVYWWTGGGAQQHEHDVGAAITAIALHPAATQLLVATQHGELHLVGDGVPAAAFAAHPLPPRRAVFLRDSRTLIAVSTDAQLLDLADGVVRTLPNATSILPGRSATELLALEADRLTARDARTGELLGSWPNADLANTLLAASADGLAIATGGFQSGLRRWDLRSGELRTAPSPGPAVDAVFAPDGRCAIAFAPGAGGRFGHLVVLDDSGTVAIDQHRLGSVASVAFAPDGDRLLCAVVPTRAADPIEPVLQEVDARTGELRREVSAQLSWCRFLDAQHVIAHDGTELSIWDVERLVRLQTLRFEAIASADLAADGSHLVLATNAGVEILRIVRRP